ncbi:MAG: sensor histidine kinase [Bacteroidales bacterium]|nr:sensor histidine kinase [Clostridium sp.]MCM1204533.1 sensor histidine kinase [Bacteroidales bacterium]
MIKFTKYMQDRWRTALLLAVGVATAEIFLLVCQINIFFRIYLLFSVAAAFLLGNFWEYQIKKDFYRDALGKLEHLDEKYLIVEMLKPASLLEEEILCDILQEANKSMLEKVNEYKHIQAEYKDYIELWVHEIKLPIATSKMIIENNKNEVTKSIGEEIREIEEYTEQALFYARSSYVNKDYYVTKCGLKEMVNESVKRNKEALINKRIGIRVEQMEQTVYTDAKWCCFILNQIMQNSIKYRKEERAEICFSAEEKKDKVVLSVRDNGIGIKPEEVKRVFNKSFTGSNGRTGKKSTGIGLYLCRKLCDKLGLGIELSSEEDVGTVVKIIFPKNSYSDL